MVIRQKNHFYDTSYMSYGEKMYLRIYVSSEDQISLAIRAFWSEKFVLNNISLQTDHRLPCSINYSRLSASNCFNINIELLLSLLFVNGDAYPYQQCTNVQVGLDHLCLHTCIVYRNLVDK